MPCKPHPIFEKVSHLWRRISAAVMDAITQRSAVLTFLRDRKSHDTDDEGADLL